MSISYLSMCKKKCINMGYSFWKTEQWNAYAHIRQDLFGFIDALCIALDEGIIAIQCTGPGGIPEHKRKILANRYSRLWLLSGGIIEVWGWSKVRSTLLRKDGKRSKKKVWTARIERITLADFT